MLKDLIEKMAKAVVNDKTRNARNSQQKDTIIQQLGTRHLKMQKIKKGI